MAASWIPWPQSCVVPFAIFFVHFLLRVFLPCLFILCVHSCSQLVLFVRVLCVQSWSFMVFLVRFFYFGFHSCDVFNKYTVLLVWSYFVRSYIWLTYCCDLVVTLIVTYRCLCVGIFVMFFLFLLFVFFLYIFLGGSFIFVLTLLFHSCGGIIIIRVLLVRVAVCIIFRAIVTVPVLVYRSIIYKSKGESWVWTYASINDTQSINGVLGHWQVITVASKYAPDCG